MSLHLLKMVWNRKRSNILLMLEVMLAFIVLFGVTAAGIFLGVYVYGSWRTKVWAPP